MAPSSCIDFEPGKKEHKQQKEKPEKGDQKVAAKDGESKTGTGKVVEISREKLNDFVLGR